MVYARGSADGVSLKAVGRGEASGQVSVRVVWGGKARIEKLVALQNDGTVRQPSDPQTPLWTIVDGAGTDGSDIMRMLEVG